MSSPKETNSKETNSKDEIKSKPKTWASMAASGGNVVDGSKNEDSWIHTSKKPPIASHNGVIKSKHQVWKKTVNVESDVKENIDDVKEKENETNNQNENTDIFPVYVIFSGWSMGEIADFIEEKAAHKNDVGIMRIDFFEGKETDRTIILLDSNLYQKLREETRHNKEFSIDQFKLGSHWYPKRDESEKSLYIQLPNCHDARQCRESLTLKLKEMVHFGMFGGDDYKISIPLESRNGSKHMGHSYVDFDESVGPDAIAFARVLLSYSDWNYKMDWNDNEDPWRVRCYYKKTKQSRSNNSEPMSRNSRNPRESSPTKTDDSAEKESVDTPKTKEKLAKVSIKIPTIDVSNRFASLSSNMDENTDKEVVETSA